MSQADGKVYMMKGRLCLPSANAGVPFAANHARGGNQVWSSGNVMDKSPLKIKFGIRPSDSKPSHTFASRLYVYFASPLFDLDLGLSLSVGLGLDLGLGLGLGFSLGLSLGLDLVLSAYTSVYLSISISRDMCGSFCVSALMF
jgi:hypothetical protein